ncbi:hypothetical protein [Luethyella okanaganae]|uniref:Nuclear transport factor 2 family protein n=1 Tax=Luethyella okanaganae TaxID=69372 RepID=A0ABW1VJM7_9MICO
MNTESLTAFQNDYLATWTEPDAERRLGKIHQMWAPSGRLVVSSLGITLSGVEEIAAHITRVHDDMIAGKGLIFAYDQAVVASDALLLRWSMLASSDEVVGRGADLVFRDSEDRAETVYMFMGVN